MEAPDDSAIWKTLTLSWFEQRVNQTFTLTAEDAACCGLELLEAESRGSTSRDAGVSDREAFSLVFRGPADPVLAQKTHGLAHPDIGEMNLFLVPIGADDKGMRYEALFN